MEKQFSNLSVVNTTPVIEVAVVEQQLIKADDWLSKFEQDEIYSKDGTSYPKLNGLRRLAKDLILTENHQLQTHVISQNFKGNDKPKGVPYAATVYTVILKDGRQFSDAADAFFKSTKNMYEMYPAAVAASRAEARTLRKVLGIKQLAAEEVESQPTPEETDLRVEATPEQIKLLQTKLARSETTLSDLIKKVTTREVYSLSELTADEARQAIQFINSVKRTTND